MGLSYKRFLLDQDDALHRLPLAKMERMLDDPTAHPIARFAGQRVRSCEVIVEVNDRVPRRVVWMTFGMLSFDCKGCLQPEEHRRHQVALAELVLEPQIATRRPEGKIINAASRFLSRGAAWTPSRHLQRRLEEAALHPARKSCL